MNRKKVFLQLFLVACVVQLAGCHLATRDQVELENAEKQQLPENAGVFPTATTATDLGAQGGSSSIGSVAQFPSGSTNAGSSSIGPTMQISGVQPGGGPVRVAIFAASDSFPNHATASIKESVSAASQTVQFVAPATPSGSYAVAVYQDLNGDGQLNRGSFGIPLEPYGFSNNAKGTMGPPAFQAAAVPNGAKELGIELTQVKF